MLLVSCSHIWMLSNWHGIEEGGSSSSGMIRWVVFICCMQAWTLRVWQLQCKRIYIHPWFQRLGDFPVFLCFVEEQTTRKISWTRNPGMAYFSPSFWPSFLSAGGDVESIGSVPRHAFCISSCLSLFMLLYSTASSAGIKILKRSHGNLNRCLLLSYPTLR